MSSPTPNAHPPDPPARTHAGAQRRYRHAVAPRRLPGQPAAWVAHPALPGQVPTPATHDIPTRIPLTNHPSS